MSSGKLYILQYRPGGEIIEMDPDGGNRRTLLGNLLDNVDGIVIDSKTNTLYWTNMGPAIGPKEGEFFQADGSIECIGLDGANRRTLVGHGLIVTAKQIAADFGAGFLYWCDREGMRVMRSNLDGSNVTVLVRNGVFPHFMAIAWMYRDDYQRAGYRVLPRASRRQVFVNWMTVLPLFVLIPLTLLPAHFGHTGAIYLLGALFAGAVFLYHGSVLALHKSAQHARRLLLASIAYIPGIFALLIANSK